jgi:hypothetical protein
MRRAIELLAFIENLLPAQGAGRVIAARPKTLFIFLASRGRAVAPPYWDAQSSLVRQ